MLCMMCVCVFLCKCVLGSPRASQPLNIRLCPFLHFGFLTSPHAIKTRSRCHPSFCRPLRSSTPVPIMTIQLTRNLTNLTKPKKIIDRKKIPQFPCFPPNQDLVTWPLSARAVFTHTCPRPLQLPMPPSFLHVPPFCAN